MIRSYIVKLGDKVCNYIIVPLFCSLIMEIMGENFTLIYKYNCLHFCDFLMDF